MSVSVLSTFRDIKGLDMRKESSTGQSGQDKLFKLCDRTFPEQAPQTHLPHNLQW